MTITLLRTKDVTKRRGISKSQHYEDVKNGHFVSPIKRGERIAHYPSDEVEALISAQIAGKSDSELCELVNLLHASRNTNPLSTFLSHSRTTAEIKQVISELNTELETKLQNGEA